MTRIYLDHAATTPTGAAARAAMLPLLGDDFNPSSLHAEGRAARAVIDRARADVADVLNVRPREVVFTASGSEAISLAIGGIARVGTRRGHLVTSATEHRAVLESVDLLERTGWSVTRLPVDVNGNVALAAFAAALRPDTQLATIMLVNNELGTIAPIRELAQIARRQGVLFHTDAVQAAAWQRIDVAALGVDLLTISSHKVYGPKGVGMLYVRGGLRLEPLVVGGGQEHGLRAGTENLAGIAGFAAALRHVQASGERAAVTAKALRDRLERGVLENVSQTFVNAQSAPRSPAISSIGFGGILAEMLLIRLDLEGIAASAGSACAAGSLEPSHVMAAIGVPIELASGVLRFSIGHATTAQEIERVLTMLPPLVAQVRGTSAIV